MTARQGPEELRDNNLNELTCDYACPGSSPEPWKSCLLLTDGELSRSQMIERPTGAMVPNTGAVAAARSMTRKYQAALKSGRRVDMNSGGKQTSLRSSSLIQSSVLY